MPKPFLGKCPRLTKLQALVKWYGGADDKKYTTGLPIEWIRGFDYEKFQSKNYDPGPYVIEWRDTANEPLGGWNCYDGYVVKVSDNKAVLERHLKMLDGVESPKKLLVCAESMVVENIVTKQFASDEDDRYSEASAAAVHSPSVCSSPLASPVMISLKGKSQKDDLDFFNNYEDVACEISGIGALNQSSNINEQQKQINRFKKAKIKKQATSTLSRSSNSRRGRHAQREDQSESEKDIEADEAATDSSQHFKQRNLLQQMIKDNQKLSQRLDAACKHLMKVKKRSREKSSSSSDHSTDSSDSELPLRKIGPKGNRVTVTLRQWRAAKAQSTYTAMGTTLLVALFPIEVLLRSNLRGGRRKCKCTHGHVRYQGLDKKALDAIYYAVEEKHPKTFNNTGLGIAINNKLTSLRRAYKSTDETHGCVAT